SHPRRRRCRALRAAAPTRRRAHRRRGAGRVKLSLAMGARGLLRRPRQTITQVLVLAAAVALLGSMILFIGHSLRTMTSSAIRSVPLDLQGPVGSYPDALKLAKAVGRQPEISEAAATATAPFSGINHRGPAGATSAGQGS